MISLKNCRIKQIVQLTLELSGEFPAQRPVTRSLDVFFDLPEPTVEQTVETPVIWDAIALIMTSSLCR